ncbi:hypothetical protein [Fibrobacter sp. UWH1]|uniref:hypothetical protein n=1 Tax=Fibrobacter sp. UWH1 TaxID=1964354 RepID=UPI000B527901|nr:hypothetical protein [Fibrobacter sp. UWH1]OWV12144.1 hypothetical protein B7992_09765 [Fibrobacter sp. UWH1]
MPNEAFIDFVEFVIQKGDIEDEKRQYFRDYLKKTSVANRIFGSSRYNEKFLDFFEYLKVPFEDVRKLEFANKRNLLKNNLFEVNEANLDFCCETFNENDGYTFSWLLNSVDSYQHLVKKGSADVLALYMLKRSRNRFNERNDVLLAVLFSPYLEGELLSLFLKAIESSTIHLSDFYSTLIARVDGWTTSKRDRACMICEKLLLFYKLAFSWNNLIIAYDLLDGNDNFIKFMKDSVKDGYNELGMFKYQKSIDKDSLRNFVRFIFETTFVSFSTFRSFVEYMSKNHQFVPDIMYDHYLGTGVFDARVIQFFNADKCSYVIGLYLGAPYRVYYRHSSLLCYLAKGHIAYVMKLLDTKRVHDNICICASLLYNLVDEKSDECIIDNVEFEYILHSIPAETIDDVFDAWKKVYDEDLAKKLINRILGYSDILLKKMDSDSVEKCAHWSHLIASIVESTDPGMMYKYYAHMKRTFEPKFNEEFTGSDAYERYKKDCAKIGRGFYGAH